MNNYRGMKAFFIVLVLMLMSFSTRAIGQAVSDDAKLHYDQGVNKVYNMMTSELYSRKQIDRNQISGGIWVHGFGPLESFRMLSGKIQARNGWYVNAQEHGDYHPRQHPPIAREWEPVKVDGKFYEYTYSYYMDVSSGYVVRVDNEVKGEVTSIDPPRVKEIVKCSITWGAPIEGNRRSWNRKNNGEEVVESTSEYVAR
jgi:hypothetical protein